jgi:hypothetical protein
MLRRDGIADLVCDNFPSVGSFRLACVTAAMIALLSWAQPASARSTFKPRIGGAMGIVPAHGHADLASGKSIPVVYHGGSVMRGVTIHTIFWAPSGYRFDGSPAAGVLGYKQMLQRFFTDVAHDSGSQSNVFSVLPEFADRRGQGHYAITYSAAADSIDVSDPYPPAGKQCPSPASVATCVTDLQVQRELDKVIQAHDPSGHGLHDLWFVFLPPDVDTCIQVGSCGTNAYAGYHSLSNLGHGPTIYALVPDPLIEFTPPPGADPQGNPEAESSIDTSAHETVEAITNPEGDGWMDPNGFEVGDKCENPEDGTPLGYAPNGSPYDQLIGGDKFLVQMMWSNARSGCVQRSTNTSSPLPLASVNLTQFRSAVSGNIGAARGGVAVLVAVARAGDVVAIGQTRTRSNGGWGPVALLSARGAPHAASDDRDLILVRYGAHGPRPDLISTGDGGNPFTESGWTGWFDLDNGFVVGQHSVQLAPCGQTGLLTLRIAGAPTPPPIERCSTESDIAALQTGPLTPATRITMSSQDNRAVTEQNPDGALIKLTVPLGEPGSVSAAGNGQVLFNPSGFPTCTADLRAQAVRCSGLRPGARYALASRHGRADSGGVARFAGFARRLRGGGVLSLHNGTGRVLTRLHVAHLRVDIAGQQTVLAGGSCQPGDYYGLPLTRPPLSVAVGFGVGGGGTVCPGSGHAAGFSTSNISQIDDLSGGLTRTQVPAIQRTTPINGETLYGRFIAQAQSALHGPHGSTFATGAPIELTITPAGSTRRVFRAPNVDIVRGVAVRALRRGAYTAIWVLKDANGDTRTIRTEFVEAR